MAAGENRFTPELNEMEVIELLENLSNILNIIIIIIIIITMTLIILLSIYYYLGGVFNKTIIPLALVGYEIIIANSAPRWLSIISYPTCARERIVN